MINDRAADPKQQCATTMSGRVEGKKNWSVGKTLWNINAPAYK